MAQKKKSSQYQRSRKTSGNSRTVKKDEFNEELVNEITLIVILALALLLFLCNFGILGTVGNAVSNVMFGLFGLMAYVFPIIVTYMFFFGIANKGNPKAIRRNSAITVLVISIGMICQMFQGEVTEGESLINKSIEAFKFSYENHKAGGILSGFLANALISLLGNVGTVLLIVVLVIICIVLITEKSFVKGVKDVAGTSKRAVERSAKTAMSYSEKFTTVKSEREKYEESKRLNAEEKKKQKEEIKKEKEELKRIKKEEEENNKILKMTEVEGTPIYSLYSEEEIKKERDDIHEINLTNLDEEYENRKIEINFHGLSKEDDINEISFADDDNNEISYLEEDNVYENENKEDALISYEEDQYIMPDEDAPKPINRSSSSDSIFKNDNSLPTNGGRTFGTKSGTAKDIKEPVVVKKPSKPYRIPPIDLLKKGLANKNSNKNELMSTASKLEQVLESFNVKAKVTDVSQGPAVTRYEMIPETGVKVSKILSLQDDIKLNLAAADIRIEAPIPGKAAIGIEVPNKESLMVAFRDLIDSKEFKSSESKLSFAVGKDLSGKVVVTDIAKMPHMLIAGATGSGKSVCINTLIMSILYKATPQEVKLIMIDPKVVELSIYNGIPHLLIPVVTDPKKANASLAWAVREMDDRYQKFAEYGVRDLKGYNAKIEKEKDENGNPIPKMFQLVVIVDELADLMMVAGKEVEESICRLAQLARAAGIHLIIATQRPSVDVITGLIKANMPSRVAFSVSSGVDSRTILDMVGAEKLLGKGDMLFYPQGYTKPARVQGAFVSDKEVSDVVEFLKNNGAGYDDVSENMVQVITSAASSAQGTASSSGNDDQDEFFYEAGRLITESGKCSIGMLQRKFKIGFNRAARIMDALAEANVVGPEEGTKPRSILMSLDEFENYMNGN